MTRPAQGDGQTKSLQGLSCIWRAGEFAFLGWGSQLNWVVQARHRPHLMRDGFSVVMILGSSALAEQCQGADIDGRSQKPVQLREQRL